MDAGEFEQLLARAREGDGESFGALYRRVHPRLIRSLSNLDAATADQVSVATWREVGRRLDGFDGSESAFRALVLGVGRRVVRHRARLDGAAPSDPATEQTRRWRPCGHDPQGPPAERTQAALATINRLTPDQADVVLLRVLGGLDGNQVARMLGKSSGAVRSLTDGALRRLDTLLTDDSVDEPVMRAGFARGWAQVDADSSLPLQRLFAEQADTVLAGARAPRSAVPSVRALEDLVQALTAPGTANELAGEAAAVRGWLLDRQTSPSAAPPNRRRVIPRSTKVAAISTALVVSFGGVAAAATVARSLPGNRAAGSLSGLTVGPTWVSAHHSKQSTPGPRPEHHNRPSTSVAVTPPRASTPPREANGTVAANGSTATPGPVVQPLPRCPATANTTGTAGATARTTTRAAAGTSRGHARSRNRPPVSAAATRPVVGGCGPSPTGKQDHLRGRARASRHQAPGHRGAHPSHEHANAGQPKPAAHHPRTTHTAKGTP